MVPSPSLQVPFGAWVRGPAVKAPTPSPSRATCHQSTSRSTCSDGGNVRPAACVPHACRTHTHVPRASGVRVRVESLVQVPACLPLPCAACCCRVAPAHPTTGSGTRRFLVLSPRVGTRTHIPVPSSFSPIVVVPHHHLANRLPSPASWSRLPRPAPPPTTRQPPPLLPLSQ